MDMKSQVRLTALLRWAQAASEIGYSVPTDADLEVVAIAKTADHPDVDQSLVVPWSATISWIIAQSSMGVADPYSQLPDELRKPAMTDRPEAPVLLSHPESNEPAPAAMPTQPADGARQRSRMSRWEENARAQTLAAIRKYAGPLRELLKRDANEGDTRLLITDLLCEGLGYDKFEDLTTEYMVRQDFADYGVRIDRQLVAFIEVKRVSQKLNERHLRQVQMYAVNEGVEWMILTNGQQWQVYHLTGGLPVVVDLVFSVDLLGPDSEEDKAELLYLLHRESLKRRQIEAAWRRSAATSPDVVLEALTSDEVLDVIRRDIKRRTGTGTSNDVLREVIRSQLLNPKALEKWGR